MFNVRLKPVSNQADWVCFMQMTDKDTGELLDLTGGSVPLTWTFEARLQGGRWLRPFLQTSSDDGSGQIYVAALGVLGLNFPVATMQALEVGSYELFLGVTNGVFTRQISLGLLPVVGKSVSIAPGYRIGLR
jgi:hypothetical protein